MRIALAMTLALSIRNTLDESGLVRHTEIAGSIRRKRPDVGDIEIVAVPFDRGNLFGQSTDPYVSIQPGMLELLGTMADDKLRKKGPRQYQFDANGAQIDLFMALPENFGFILALRTGPSSFSKKIVTQRSKGGLLPSYMRSRDGRLWVVTNHLRVMRSYSIPDEQTLFTILEIPYIPPEERK